MPNTSKMDPKTSKIEPKWRQEGAIWSKIVAKMIQNRGLEGVWAALGQLPWLQGALGLAPAPILEEKVANMASKRSPKSSPDQ